MARIALPQMLERGYSKSLASGASLAPQRLLSDQRIGTCGTSMDFVLNQMR